MKRLKHNFWTRLMLLSIIIVIGSGCNIFSVDDRPDPNNTELDTIIENPTRSEVNTLVAGTLAGLRTDLNIYFIDVSMVGREMYRFLAAEPRFTADLLGKENAQLDPGSFYTTRPWTAYYTNIRNANILIESTNTVSDPNVLSEEEKNGVLGFAKTIKAYQYLLALSLTNENGIRQQNQSDLFNPGPQLNKSEAQNLITTLLDEAATHLDNAGSSFAFTLSDGFDGFNSPTTYRQFNRALRARIAAYHEDWQGVIDALNESFIDESADLGLGVHHIFTVLPNDQLNPLFADPNAGAGDSWVAHPSWIADAENGDERITEKVTLRDVPAALDDLSSNYGLSVYDSQRAPIPVIRNGELILLRAEALIQRNNAGDLQDAEDDINTIRNAAGLPDYNGNQTQAALTDEMLNQRRYELFFEGHRWIDMRRYDRLDQLPIDRPGDTVWESFPIPEQENL